MTPNPPAIIPATCAYTPVKDETTTPVRKYGSDTYSATGTTGVSYSSLSFDHYLFSMFEYSFEEKGGDNSNEYYCVRDYTQIGTFIVNFKNQWSNS